MTRPMHYRITCHICGRLLTSKAPCPTCGAPAKPVPTPLGLATQVLIAYDRGESVRSLLAARCRTAAEAEATCAAVAAVDYDRWEHALLGTPVDPVKDPKLTQMIAVELSAIRRARDELARGVLPGALDGELAAACADLEAERLAYSRS